MNIPEHIVFLSLGSNVGNRLFQLRKAETAIREFAFVKKISSVYETAPVGPIPQSDFLNMVLEIQTGLAPHDLMLHLMHVEEGLGRQRDVKWGPRSIDIDILFYDHLIINASGLVIPHAHYANRKFVLEPLCEIAPDWICPVRNKTMREINCSLVDEHAVRKTNDRLVIETTSEIN